MKKKIPFFLKTLYALSFVLVAYLFMPKFENTALSNKGRNVVSSSSLVYGAIPYSSSNYTAIKTFVGTMTGYGPDCVGCGGKTGCSPAQDVRNGNIYFDDSQYGKVRIIAADSEYSCGTVIRITASNVSKEPLIAVVLDRGGAINGNKMDLLFESEAATKNIGFQRNVKYEVLRTGWESNMTGE